MFAGIYQILHTPFTDAGEIDWESLGAQIDFCLKAGVHGLVTPVMASEFFALSDAERTEVVEYTLSAVNHRVPVLIGVQGLTERLALAFAEHAAAHGADGLLAMPPYLRKASTPGVESYFRQLAQLGLPLMIQNAPAPVGSPLSPRALADLLRDEPAIEYIKEETPPILQRITQIRELAGDACKGVFGGANGLFLPEELARGACGNMPAGGAVDIQVRIYDRYMAGDRAGAEALHFRLLPLLIHAQTHGVTFHKWLLWRRGVLASSHARDPQQLPLDEHDKRTIEQRWQLVADEALADYPLSGQGERP